MSNMNMDQNAIQKGIESGKTGLQACVNALRRDVLEKWHLRLCHDRVEETDLEGVPRDRHGDHALGQAAAAWIHAGGAQHTSFSYAITPEHLRAFAKITGIEFLLIDENTRVNDFKDHLRWNDTYYR